MMTLTLKALLQGSVQVLLVYLVGASCQRRDLGAQEGAGQGQGGTSLKAAGLSRAKDLIKKRHLNWPVAGLDRKSETDSVVDS